MKNEPYPLNNVPQINNLKDMVIYCADTYKDSTAFQYEKDNKLIKISFKEFLYEINGLGTVMYHLGLHDMKIAILGENSYYWILSYFAVINGGNIIVPLEPEMMEKDLITVLVDTEVSCVIVSQKYIAKVQKIQESLQLKQIFILERYIPSLVCEGKIALYEGERKFIEYKVDDDACGAILYTSGTTSKPKGVMLSHKNIATNTVASIRNVYFAGTSILILPLHHTFSFTASILCVMLSGRTIFINTNLKELKNDVVKYRPQNLVLVPTIIESLYKQIWIQAKRNKKDKLLRKLILLSNILLELKIDLRKVLFSSVLKSFGGKLDFIISGGAPIQNKYVKAFRELGIQVLNGYGITECSPVLSVNRNHYFRDHSAGQVLDGVEIKIVDGEILAKGDIVTAGYYKDERQTEEAFQDGWFKTGDLGCMDGDGFLYITGRKKNLIVLGNGKNISPEEIEEYFYKLDYIKEIVIYQNGDQIEAEIYLGNDNKKLYEKNIEQDLLSINSQLPIYKNISKVIVREIEFPKTATKKIKRG